MFIFLFYFYPSTVFILIIWFKYLFYLGCKDRNFSELTTTRAKFVVFCTIYF